MIDDLRIDWTNGALDQCAIIEPTDHLFDQCPLTRSLNQWIADPMTQIDEQIIDHRSSNSEFS
jgi:hypothetical protein